MMIYRHDGVESHRTEYSLALVCMWVVSDGGVPRIVFFRDNQRNRAAVIYPDIPMVGHPTGTVGFESPYPTLAEAIVYFPEYETSLWESVRREFTRAGERYKVPDTALAWCPDETISPTTERAFPTR